MLVIEIPWEEVWFFLALVVSGAAYGMYCFYRGKKVGFDDAMYTLQLEGFVNIDEDTLEVTRMSDRQYKEYKASYCEEE